jgi:DNA-binding MarR family transcriptional regulator
VNVPAHESVPEKTVAALERLGQALQVLVRDAATHHRLSPIQARLLLRLAHDPEERRRPGALAREFDVTPASLSDSLAALERKGLIVRRRRAADRRGFALSVTRAGSELAERLGAWARPLERAIGALPEDEQIGFMGSLYGLIAALEREGVVSVARMCVTCRHFRPRAHPGERAPHHCALLDRPLAERSLRIDCAEHEQAA